MAKALTPGPFTAQMVSDFCIPVLVGKAKEPAPADGTWLSQPQRQLFGLGKEGRTIAYALGDARVFLDLQAHRSQIWFEHPDAERSLKLVEDAMKRATPKMKQTLDVERTRPGLRARVYQADMERGIVAQVEIAYPEPTGAGAAKNRFMVRVYAMMHPKAPDPFSAIRGMSETLAKKKK